MASAKFKITISKGEGLRIKQKKRHHARLALRKIADINQEIETDAKQKEVATGWLQECQTKQSI